MSPVEPSSGWFANIACMNGTAAVPSAAATQYIAFAARVEYSVPCDARSRIEIGWMFRVIVPSVTRPWIASPYACSNWLQTGHMKSM